MSIGSRIGGPGLPLPQGTNNISLAASEIYNIPVGQYLAQPGAFTFLQWFDSGANIWRTDSNPIGRPAYINSDGSNFRLANLTGCPLGALVTTAGSGYTSAPTVTASAGGSTWLAIVGGAINTTVTITAGGTNYQFAPTLIVSAPPVGGLQATATCTISGGVINAVTVTNQGAGYTSAPTITVMPDPRDTLGSGGILTPALTGSGTITGLVMVTPGTALTAVPTLAFTGGGGSSAAATTIMCLTVTGVTVGTAGTGYGTSLPYQVWTSGGVTAGAAAYTNPLWQTGLLLPRPANLTGTSSAGGAVTTTLAITDGGLFEAVPTVLPITSQLITAAGALTATVGGVTDTSVLQPV